MAVKSGQRFIRENRAPRVHIEYEVETYGSRQKIELPFVMGVMSDLSGKSQVEKKPLDKRDFVEIDMDNFDARMEAIAPLRAGLPTGVAPTISAARTGSTPARRRAARSSAAAATWTARSTFTTSLSVAPSPARPGSAPSRLRPVRCRAPRR